MQRAATHLDHYEHPDGTQVNLVDGTEGTGLRVASVLWPGNAHPARRLDPESGDVIEEVDDAPDGLVIFGHTKWSRVPWSVAVQYAPEEAEPAILTAVFRALLDEYGTIASLARASGLSRRTFEYKRDGASPVTRWDIMALERALQMKER